MIIKLFIKPTDIHLIFTTHISGKYFTQVMPLLMLKFFEFNPYSQPGFLFMLYFHSLATASNPLLHSRHSFLVKLHGERLVFAGLVWVRRKYFHAEWLQAKCGNK